MSTTLKVPAEALDEVWGLLDEVHRQQHMNSHNQANFRLWSRLTQLFPKTDFNVGEWRLDSKRFNDLSVTDAPLPAAPHLKLGKGFGGLQ